MAGGESMTGLPDAPLEAASSLVQRVYGLLLEARAARPPAARPEAPAPREKGPHRLRHLRRRRRRQHPRRRTPVARSSVLLSMLPLPPDGAPPAPQPHPSARFLTASPWRRRMARVRGRSRC
jgi:hypothetical protein